MAPMDSGPPGPGSLHSSKYVHIPSSPRKEPAPPSAQHDGSLNHTKPLAPRLDALCSDEREEAYSAMWDLLLGSDDHARAAGLPGAPASIKHTTLREYLSSMRVI